MPDYQSRSPVVIAHHDGVSRLAAQRTATGIEFRVTAPDGTGGHGNSETIPKGWTFHAGRCTIDITPEGRDTWRTQRAVDDRGTGCPAEIIVVVIRWWWPGTTPAGSP
jgi:hypothetical protein